MYCPNCAQLIRERDALRAALSEISKSEGKFSMEPLIHASNVIENMVKIAEDALIRAPITDDKL